MKQIIHISFLLLLFSSCTSQTNKTTGTIVGGPCEGCEAIYEYGDNDLNNIDTLPNFEHSNVPLKVSGTIYEMDTKTPAENVILYVYHTNSEGIYETKGNEKGWGKRHGYIRGWIKTGKDGKYTFYTSRPAAYPNTDEPEHIHITVKEPKRNEYYIDAVVFSDDELLTSENKKALTNRGGSGIVTPVNENGILTVNRDIILGLNIPNYE